MPGLAHDGTPIISGRINAGTRGVGRRLGHRGPGSDTKSVGPGVSLDGTNANVPSGSRLRETHASGGRGRGSTLLAHPPHKSLTFRTSWRLLRPEEWPFATMCTECRMAELQLGRCVVDLVRAVVVRDGAEIRVTGQEATLLRARARRRQACAAAGREPARLKPGLADRLPSRSEDPLASGLDPKELRLHFEVEVFDERPHCFEVCAGCGRLPSSSLEFRSSTHEQCEA